MSERYRKISLGWFFFSSRPARVTDRSLQIALCNIVVQIANHDVVYSKAVSTIIANSVSSLESSSPNFIWKEFIASQYPAGSTRKLFLVLVGIDKMEETDQSNLRAILEDTYKDKLNIRILLVGQPNKHVIYHQIEDVDVPEIEVTIENMEDDMKLYVESQIQKSKALRKLSDELKEMITAKFLKNDGGFGLAALQLELIEDINQPEDIPSALENLPEGYKAALEDSLRQISHGIQSKKESESNKLLFYWIAQAYIGLTISQLRTIVSVKGIYENFDVRQNVDRLCASVLEVCDPPNSDDGEDDDEDEDEDESGDGSSDTTNDWEDESESDASETSQTSNSKSSTSDESEDTEEDDDQTIGFRTKAYADIFCDDDWTIKNYNVSNLVEHPFQAKFDICITIMKIITMSPTDADYEKTRVLEEYCVTYFMDHFFELKLDDKTYISSQKVSPTLSQSVAMIEALYDVFMKPECTSNAIEGWDEEIYSDIMSIEQADEATGEDKKTLPEVSNSATSQSDDPSTPQGEYLAAILIWLRSCEYFSDAKASQSALKPDTLTWVNAILKQPTELLKPLAKEHVAHWFAKLDTNEARYLFSCARTALKSVRLDILETFQPDQILTFSQTGIDLGDDEEFTTDCIVKVADFFPDLEKSDCGNRAVGQMMTNDSQQAFEYFEIALSLAKTELSKFYTYVSLANAQYKAGDYSDAVASANTALGIHKSESFDSVEESEKIHHRKYLYQVYQILGDCLSADPDSGYGNAAIEAHSRARELVIQSDYEINDGEDGTYTLDRMVDILAAQGEWSALVSKITSWSPREKGLWIGIDTEYNRGQNIVLMRAAKLSDGLDALRKCYEEAIAVTSDDDDDDDDDDNNNGILVRYQLAYASYYVLEDDDEAYEQLQIILSNRNSGNVARETRKIARWLLLEIIGNQARVAPEKWVRRLLIKDMQSIVDHGPKKAKDLYSILPNIQLSGAYLEIGDVETAKELLGTAFDIGVEALRDTVRSNDKDAFRLLAKVLYLADFERDAGIAISAVFSVVNLQIKDDESSNGAEDQHGAETDVQVNEGEEIKEPESQNSPRGEEEQSTVEVVLETLPPKENETPVTAEQARISSFRAASKLEDLNGTFARVCDGSCKEPSRRHWPPNDPLYMCLICADIDLCQSCYDIRMRQNNGEKSEYWKRVCGVNHKYLKGPIEGWSGVKDGILRIGDERIEFEHWLEDIEVKWKQWMGVEMEASGDTIGNVDE